jgi:hypothetical protein
MSDFDDFENELLKEEERRKRLKQTKEEEEFPQDTIDAAKKRAEDEEEEEEILKAAEDAERRKRLDKRIKEISHKDDIDELFSELEETEEEERRRRLFNKEQEEREKRRKLVEGLRRNIQEEEEIIERLPYAPTIIELPLKSKLDNLLENVMKINHLKVGVTTSSVNNDFQRKFNCVIDKIKIELEDDIRAFIDELFEWRYPNNSNSRKLFHYAISMKQWITELKDITIDQIIFVLTNDSDPNFLKLLKVSLEEVRGRITIINKNEPILPDFIDCNGKKIYSPYLETVLIDIISNCNSNNKKNAVKLSNYLITMVNESTQILLELFNEYFKFNTLFNKMKKGEIKRGGKRRRTNKNKKRSNKNKRKSNKNKRKSNKNKRRSNKRRSNKRKSNKLSI